MLGCEVNNEGYLINCLEKLSCKLIDHQRKVEKSTVSETLFINTGKPCVLDGVTPNLPIIIAGAKNIIELLFVCIESENANNCSFLWQLEKHHTDHLFFSLLAISC